jgi:hypothetical protein
MLKKIFLAVAIYLCLVSISSAGEEYMADTSFEPADFRGVKWQESLDRVIGMEELYRADDGTQITCSRAGEDLTFGGAELASVEYIFVDRKLSMVSVVAKGEKNEHALLEEARSIFGRETLNAGDDYIWRFTNVAIMYSKEPDEQSVLFYKYIGFLNK